MSLDQAKMPSLKDKLRDQAGQAVPVPVTPTDEAVTPAEEVVAPTVEDTKETGDSEVKKPKGRRLNK